MHATHSLTFTRHGKRRLNERIALCEAEVRKLIQENKAIPLGREKSRIHYMFFSEPDQECFVVVLDYQTREVITILPIDYHNRWRISLDLVMQARDLITSSVTQ